MSDNAIGARLDRRSSTSAKGDARQKARARPGVMLVLVEHQVPQTVEGGSPVEPAHAMDHMRVVTEEYVDTRLHDGFDERTRPHHGHVDVFAPTVVAEQNQVVL